MRREVDNRNKDSNFYGPYAGRDMNVTNIIMLQDSERKFVVTHNADIKPVSYFTGRETELQELRQRIEEGRKSVLVSGMGGIGKTQICRQLFEEYSKNENGSFSHIGYIEYDGDMNSSLQRCLKFKKQKRQEDNLEAAWKELEYLAADGKLLLFVDNVSVPIGQDAGLGQLKQIPGAVVLTSRRTSFSKEFEPFKVGFLSTEQCKAVYEKNLYEDINNNKKVPDVEVPDLIYIIEKLAANHTITIEFLAHLARTKNWTAITLRKELETRGFCLKYKDKYNDDRFINIQEEYEKLYDLSELTDAEQNILEAFSVFPYIPLEAEICNQWLLEDAGASEDDDILIGLYRKGWLQLDMEWKSYSLHPVFAQFIYEKCKPTAKSHLGLIEACQESLNISKNGSVLQCQTYIPFAQNLIEKIDMGKGKEQADFAYNLANLLLYIAEYETAEKWYKISLEIYLKEFGENHLHVARNYSALAKVYNERGNYTRAEELNERSIRIYEDLLGESHPQIARSYSNLAKVYENQGRYIEAENLYEKAILIKMQLGDNSVDTAMICNDLALVYIGQGEYFKAEKLYKKIIKIYTKELGENDRNTASFYNNLGGTYENQGKYKEAGILYKKSLVIQKKVLGEYHPNTASGYNNLANVYRQQGESMKAKVLYEKSLEIREKVLGEYHPDTASCYNNLAMLYADQKNYAKAEELLERCLKICKRVLGEKHPHTICCYDNLAFVYRKQRKYQKALEYSFKAFKYSIIILGLENPISLSAYENMEMTYSEWNPNGEFKWWLQEKMKESEL